ncbi:MAG: PRC-barrel domain containing protein [Desulfobacteraceae bacterium]|nr:MAG: PRC-barrel domain containing protein [Desulfobacteraceae bacterium]
MKRTGIAAVLMTIMFVSATAFAAGTETQQSTDQSQTVPGIQSQEAAPGAQDQTMSKEMSKDQTMSMRSEYKASEILDKNLVNAQGDDLGKVEDLIVGQNGEISHLIISRGGVLGMGEDLIPIPWSSAQANFQDDKLMVNLDKAKLEQAPSFKADNWDEFFSPGYQENVRAFYGEEGAAGTQPSLESTPGSQLPGTETTPGATGSDSGSSGAATSPESGTQPETAPKTQ